MSVRATDICVTELDAVRLENMLEQLRRRRPDERESVHELQERVDAARVVHSKVVEPQVVTMNSLVTLADRESGTTTDLRLVYADEVGGDVSRVSVLSPVGRRLLGACVGDVLRVPVAGRAEREFVVSAIPWQPEANGRYDL